MTKYITIYNGKYLINGKDIEYYRDMIKNHEFNYSSCCTRILNNFDNIYHDIVVYMLSHPWATIDDDLNINCTWCTCCTLCFNCHHCYRCFDTYDTTDSEGAISKKNVDGIYYYIVSELTFGYYTIYDDEYDDDIDFIFNSKEDERLAIEGRKKFHRF